MSTDNKKGFSLSRRVIFVQDTVLSLVAALLAILTVRWLSEPIPGFSGIVWRWLGLATLGFIVGGMLCGLWRMETRYMNASSANRIGGAVLVKSLVLTLVLVFGLVRLPSLTFSILVILTDLLLTGIFLVAPRYVSMTLKKEELAVSRQVGKKTALVAGTGDSSVALAYESEARGKYHVLGYLSADRSKSGLIIGNLPVYYGGTPTDIASLQWRLGGVDTILFPPDWENDEQREGSTENNVPENPDTSKMTLLGYGFKRGFDIALSGGLILVFGIPMLICALAIRMEDGKPVIYRQERIGKGGKPFNILKFRSMRVDAEKGGKPALYSGDDDPRLTKVGKFLRQHHLDELPQLFNVFRGDMSFIGYRPERQFYIEKIMERNPRYRYLYQIRPGVTSYATLYNGYTDTLEKMLTRLDLDLYYLRNHSVLFDAKVLGLTFLSIIGGKKF